MAGGSGVVFAADCNELLEAGGSDYRVLFVVAMVAGRPSLNDVHFSVDGDGLLVYLVVGEFQISNGGGGRVILYLSLAITLREGGDAAIVLDARLVDVCRHLTNIQAIWVQVVTEKLTVLKIDGI